VESPGLRRLLQDVADTDDEEISCTECFDLVSEHVDAEVAGIVGDRTMPRLQQHLRQCDVCREEYEVLRDLARLEAEGRAPSADDLRRSL
jgi:hypothetical protein